MNSGRDNKYNLIIPAVAAIVLWTVLGVFFRYYYDLNDDIMIKDIISGIYTGTPDAHNNQMMYPISMLFVGLYRLLPDVPWFGLFEIGCFILCYIIIGNRIITLINRFWLKIIYIIIQTLLWFGAYLWELTMIQYTVVSGILCVAASVWVYCTDCETGHDIKNIVKGSIKAYWPAIVLATVAFNIRSEMFLLMCPFMAAAGICKWISEKTRSEGGRGLFAIDTIIKYASIIVGILVLIVTTVLIDTIAYSSEEWREYRDFFDARTEVYDFTGIPDYDANIEFYERVGTSQGQYQLLIDYNYELDQSIDVTTLNTIADYVKSGEALKPDGTPMSSSSRTVKSAIGEYIRGAIKWYIPSEDVVSPFADDASQLSPMNMIVLVLYVTLAFIAYFVGDWRYLIELPAMVTLRSVAWIYIYYRGRLVPRITHPMYMIEIVILLALIITEFNLNRGKISVHVKGLGYLAFVLLAVICALNMSMLVGAVKRKQNYRDELNVNIQEFNEYVANHSDEYYLVDVYSTVEYTEPIFGIKRVSKANQQLAGGWVAKSPLDINKRSGYADNIVYVNDIEILLH